MVILALIVICWVVIILIGARYAQHLLNKSYTTLHFNDVVNTINLPVVTMQIQGKDFNFIVDSGADQSYINKTALDGLEYITAADHHTITAATGTTECVTCELDLEYKDNWYTTTFCIVDFTNAFAQIKQETGLTVHGMLGVEFLVKHKCILDFIDLTMISKE